MTMPGLFLVAVALLLLSACAGPKIAGSDPGGVIPFVGTVAGNEIGGVVPLAGNTKDQALKMAQTLLAACGRLIGLDQRMGRRVLESCTANSNQKAVPRPRRIRDGKENCNTSWMDEG
jgi:hypothetical protein